MSTFTRPTRRRRNPDERVRGAGMGHAQRALAAPQQPPWSAELGERRAVMDLIAAHSRPQRHPCRQPQRLLHFEYRSDVEQTRPATLAPGGPSTPSRFIHNRAEHLETAAIPSTRTPRSRVRRNSLVQSTLPQPGQIGDRRTGSGQHDEVGVGDICGPGRKPHCDIGLQPQRVNVGEVADPRQPHHADPKRVLHGARPPGDIEPVFGVQQTSGLHGNTPSTGRPVSRAISRLAGPSRTSSPRNLFTTNPATNR